MNSSICDIIRDRRLPTSCVYTRFPQGPATATSRPKPEASSHTIECVRVTPRPQVVSKHVAGKGEAMIRTSLILLATTQMGLCAADVALAQGTEAVEGRPVVTVLDAGAAPRQVLRYRFDDGFSETASIEMRIRLNVSNGGPEQQVVAFPTIRMLVDLGPFAVAEDGSARYDFAISSADLIDTADTNPSLAAALRGSLGQLPSVSGWARIDARGATLAGDIDVAAGVDPQLTQVFDSAEQALQQMSAPLPAEAVGPGAQWQVIQEVQSAGFSVTQSAVYTLTSIVENEVTMDVAVTQTGSDQAVALAGLPPGIEARLDSLESTSTGSMRINLNRFVPELASDVSMAVAISVAVQGQTQRTGLDMQTETIISPVD